MKRVMNKIIATVLSFAVLLTVFFGALSTTVLAAEDAAFLLEKVSETNDEVVVSLSLKSGEFKYATFIFTYGEKISACTSIVNGDTLKNYIENSENVIATSNSGTGFATAISVAALNEVGSYFVITFSKLSSDIISEDDITVIEDDHGYQITKNFVSDAEISLSLDKVDLYYGQTIQLSAVLNPDTGETIAWASLDEGVATVENGLITAVGYGETTVTATTQSGKSASCSVSVDMKMKDNVSAQINAKNGFIYGPDIFGKTKDEIKNLFEGAGITVNSNSASVATGDTIVFKKNNGEVFKTLTVVIFGDVNCDGVYDGTDSVIVGCFEKGMLNEDQVSEAVYTAADCNHDGVINVFDCMVLNDAGLVLATVPQITDKRLDVSSVEYAEYLSCISQSIPDVKITEETPVENTQTSFLDEVIAFFKVVFEYFVNMITKLFA